MIITRRRAAKMGLVVPKYLIKNGYRDEIQQKLVESPLVCIGRIDVWLRLIFHYYNY